MLKRCVAVCVVVVGVPALGQVDPSGIDFVTITNPGNAPWTGGGSNNGRGQVNYEYRIGRFEVTTAQWCEFINAALDRPANDRIPNVFAPTQWGAVGTTAQNGGQRFAVPAGKEMIPTGGVGWRTCAIYCNWLHNGKASNREAFLSGAYDVSTFGYNGSLFTDQLTHSPGARYWIPTLDEWMKASHFDPNRNGPGQGGWWQYANASDTPPVYGPPNILINGSPTTSNARWTSFHYPGLSPFNVNLGAYSATSPWGLFDASGGTSEWVEESLTFTGENAPRYRVFEGGAWNLGSTDLSDCAGYYFGNDVPTWFGYEVGLRIAAVIPAPSVLIACWLIATAYGTRRSRRVASISMGAINRPLWGD